MEPIDRIHAEGISIALGRFVSAINGVAETMRQILDEAGRMVRRTRTGAWTVYGRRFRTRTLAIRYCLSPGNA